MKLQTTTRPSGLVVLVANVVVADAAGPGGAVPQRPIAALVNPYHVMRATGGPSRRERRRREALHRLGHRPRGGADHQIGRLHAGRAAGSLTCKRSCRGVTAGMQLLLAGDAEIWGTTARSLLFSGTATRWPRWLRSRSGSGFAVGRVPARRLFVAALYAGMGMPTVLVGLVLTMLLWREGPLGRLGLLFTPPAVVLGQIAIAFPLVAGLSHAAVNGLERRVLVQVRALGANGRQAAWLLAVEARRGILVALLAGLGHALSEVGAAMMPAETWRARRGAHHGDGSGGAHGTVRSRDRSGALLFAIACWSMAARWRCSRGRAVENAWTEPGPPAESVPFGDFGTDSPPCHPAFGGLIAGGFANPPRVPILMAIGLGLDGVAHARAGRPVLDVAALAIAPGEAVAIVGPNGAGKSTMLAILAGLEAPARGAARIGELPATQLAARRRIALLPQDAPLLEGTAAANVERPLALRGVGARERRRRAGALIERMGLGELARRHAKTLSGGEARRVALARALVTEPEALLLDEPFNGVDDPARERLVGEIRAGVRAAERTLVLVTQRRDEALRLATRLIVLWQGAVRQDGPIEEVLARPADTDVARFLGLDNVLKGRVVGDDADGVIVDSARRRAARGAAVAAPAAGAGGLGGLQPRAGRAARTVRGRGRVAAQHRSGARGVGGAARGARPGRARRRLRGRPEHRRRGDPLGGRRAGAAAGGRGPGGAQGDRAARRPGLTRAHRRRGWWRVRVIWRHPRSIMRRHPPMSVAREQRRWPRESQPDGPAGGVGGRPAAPVAANPGRSGANRRLDRRGHGQVDESTKGSGATARLPILRMPDE